MAEQRVQQKFLCGSSDFRMEGNVTDDEIWSFDNLKT